MILEVTELTKVFGSAGRRQTAVDAVSFCLETGQCLGLIGESGSGKSTTANMVAGLLPATSGSISLCGTEIVGAKPKDIRVAGRNLQMVFQNPSGSFDPRKKLGWSVAEPLRPRKLPESERQAAVLAALERVGLKREYADRYAWQLSGGECQRAAIARALIGQPKLVLCDELTSSLDVSVQAQIIDLLYKLKKESDTSYLFISHDLAVVSGICDHVAVMYRGGILEYGETMQVITSPAHPYTQVLIKNALAPGREENLPVNAETQTGGCKYYRFCTRASARCKEQMPSETDMGNGHRVRCFPNLFSFESCTG